MSGRAFTVLCVVLVLFGGALGLSIGLHVIEERQANWATRCQNGGGHLVWSGDDLYCVAGGGK